MRGQLRFVFELADSASGQVIVSAAGITQYGPREAGEFLTDEALLRAALAKVPAGWQRRKLQVLLHTRVYQGIPAAPTVLAVDSWQAEPVTVSLSHAHRRIDGSPARP